MFNIFEFLFSLFQNLINVVKVIGKPPSELEKNICFEIYLKNFLHLASGDEPDSDEVETIPI